MNAHLAARLVASAALCGGLAGALGCSLGCSDGTPPKSPAPATPAPVAERRGLWVLAEGSQRVLDDARRVEPFLKQAQALGATDLFVQVYRAGRAWYDSDLADATPYHASIEAGGADALALLLERAAGRFRVHAWVNVLSLAQNPQAPIVRDLGREAVLTDRRGRSLLDYPHFEIPPPEGHYYRMGTPGVYLDPGAPGVAERLAATFAELLTRYPRLDGLHLDYARYPDVLPFVPGSRFGVGLDFGYGEATRRRFFEETGLEAPFGDRIGPANAWDDWRRDQVTALVRRIAKAARAARPGVQLSAAVWTYADRSYLALGQDWRRWLEEDLIDFAVPMAYTLDDRLLRYQVQSFAGLPYGDRIWIGLGTWLFASEPQRALAQIALAHQAGARRISLFSYDSIVSTPALYQALREQAQGAPATAGPREGPAAQPAKRPSEAPAGEVAGGG